MKLRIQRAQVEAMVQEFPHLAGLRTASSFLHSVNRNRCCRL
ncbi:MAG: hypothetical protein ACYDD9_01225 [Acidithiobacillus sp.]|uniref:Uncharacterized protein n=1 Tax=Acidithiobacillus ferruginosus TaxID=3063951 RepID=A0ACD5IM39_9PROT|nr:hypothetical protein [Acidithiobacillus ferruginosus]